MSSGNENVCYHNFLCANPSKIFGVSLASFNAIFSNVVFFSLGLLIILIAKRRFVAIVFPKLNDCYSCYTCIQYVLN